MSINFHVVICIFVVVYLYVSDSGSITSVGEERADGDDDANI